MCDYTGTHFGARYPDACCCDGLLWDLDSGDDDGDLTHGGDIPCPACNTTAYLDDAREDAEGTSWGEAQFERYCGAMLIEGAWRKALAENPEAARAWAETCEPIKTHDWPDRAAVIEFRASPDTIREVTWTPAPEATS